MTRQVRPALIWCPFPDEQEAADVAATLLDEQLVACANILPAMRSLFAWNGVREEAREVGALFKTNSAVLESAVARLSELHSYDEPAVLGWLADAAAPATSAWLGKLSGSAGADCDRKASETSVANS